MQDDNWFKWQLGIPGVASDMPVIDSKHLRWSRRKSRPRAVAVPPRQTELAELFPEDLWKLKS